MTDLPTLASHLRELPALADQAATLERTSGGRTALGIRAAVDTRTPKGLKLGAIDVEHGRQHPHLLERIAKCGRRPVPRPSHRSLADPGPAERVIPDVGA